MFDIDGTLIESYALDSQCYVDAVQRVTGLAISDDWASYRHVTDSGILNEVIRNHSLAQAAQVHASVKQAFLENLAQAVHEEPIQPIRGAADFLDQLYQTQGVTVSFATGAWLEAAQLKLSSAGICVPRERMASANDHCERIEIMKIAAARAGTIANAPCTYFGDGPWDQAACAALGFNFVLVGNRFDAQPCIAHYEPAQHVMEHCGLG